MISQVSSNRTVVWFQVTPWSRLTLLRITCPCNAVPRLSSGGTLVEGGEQTPAGGIRPGTPGAFRSPPGCHLVQRFQDTSSLHCLQKLVTTRSLSQPRPPHPPSTFCPRRVLLPLCGSFQEHTEVSFQGHGSRLLPPPAHGTHTPRAPALRPARPLAPSAAGRPLEQAPPPVRTASRRRCRHRPGSASLLRPQRSAIKPG